MSAENPKFGRPVGGERNNPDKPVEGEGKPAAAKFKRPDYKKEGGLKLTPDEARVLAMRNVRRADTHALGINPDATPEEIEAARMKRREARLEEIRARGIEKFGLKEDATIEDVLDAMEEARRVELARKLNLPADASWDNIREKREAEQSLLTKVKKSGLGKPEINLADVRKAMREAAHIRLVEEWGLSPDTTPNEAERIRAIMEEITRGGKRDTALTPAMLQKLLRDEAEKKKKRFTIDSLNAALIR